MGVRTTADENLDEAHKHLKEALALLVKLTVEEPYGFDDYSEETQQKWEEALIWTKKAHRLLK